MIRSLWTASTGMIAQQMNMDIIANNLSNVNTVGFKKTRLDFQDLYYQNVRLPGEGADGRTIGGLQIGLGSKPVATLRIFTQGDFQQSGNLLDLAIRGDGFFQVTMTDGKTAYTRDGSFKIDGEGKIITSDGYLLQPEITVPENATNIAVSLTGVVTATLEGEQDPVDLGQIQLARFINPAGLSAEGQNLLYQTSASGEPIVGNPGEDALGNIAQGYLEMSNVQIVEEMINMIVAQRAYEINSKSIQTADNMMETAQNIKR